VPYKGRIIRAWAKVCAVRAENHACETEKQSLGWGATGRIFIFNKFLRSLKSGDIIAGSAENGDSKCKAQEPLPADKKLQICLTRKKIPVYNLRLS
jgi:hypothetical protein